MDRVQVFPGAIPLETDLLNTNKNTMIGLAKLAAAMFGTGTIANGLSVVPTGPASLQVFVNPGEIYQLVNLDGTAYSSLAADTTHQIVKQGILLDQAILSCPAPATGGFSINYLIEATYSDVDALPVVLPYYNASNPAVAYSGPANAGTTNNTVRQGKVTLTAKAGIAAATGTQTTPAADAGYVGLYVVTVANGQTQITAPNIVQFSGAAILPVSLIAAAQNGLYGYALDTGTANVYQVAYSPSVIAITDGIVLRFKAKTANTGASTFSPNGLAAQPIVGGAHSALQGNEIVANSDVWVQWNSTLASWILIDSTGGAIQTAPGAQTNQAVNLGQFASSKSASGYQKLPGGLILQWGAATTAATAPGSVVVSFPIAFPNALVALHSTRYDSASSSANTVTNVSNPTLSAFTLWSSTGPANVYWSAIGY